MSAVIKVMHLFCHGLNLLPEIRIKRDSNAPACLSVEERALCNGATEHLFQAQGLSAQLQLVCPMSFGRASFVFYGKGAPKPAFSMQRNSLLRQMELHHIAFSGKAQGVGPHWQVPQNEGIASPLPLAGIVCPGVKQRAFHRAQIFPPLLFNVDQRPLPAAESKVLQSGEREEVLLGVDHPMR